MGDTESVSTIEFRVRFVDWLRAPPNEPYFEVQPWIGGRSLAGRIAEIKAEQDSYYGRNPAQYLGRPAGEVLPPRRDLLGDSSASIRNRRETVLLVCGGCGENACDDIGAMIDAAHAEVCWHSFTGFKTNSAGEPVFDYQSLGPFRFDLRQMEAALEAASADFERLRADVAE